MGLATWLGFKPSAPPSTPVSWQRPTYELIPEGMSLDEYLRDHVLNVPVEKLYREQPHLRTVVGFIARNIAQLGIHVFERDAADGRNRVRAGALHDLLDEPNNDQTQFELIEATVASRMLYDETYWYVARDLRAPSGWVIRHIPTPWILGTVDATAFSATAYQVAIPNAAAPGRWVEVPAENMVVFHGWNPIDPLSGTSPVHALKAILAEQIHAAVFRDQMWKNGGRVGTYLYRPVDAPKWGDGENSPRSRFIKGWQENYAGDHAPKAGGTPLLEDGMEIRQTRFSAKDEQFIEASKLSLETCAQVYFINPTMVGVLDDANYSNVREFRKSLYGDTLGPEIERMQQRINRRVVPLLADRRTTYVEFNLRSKLEGSFEEQADLLQKSVGAPWMTVDEARAKQNMPAIDGGDKLIRPLNVTQNGDHNPIPAESSGDDDETDATEQTTSEEPKRNGHTNDNGERHALHVHV